MGTGYRVRVPDPESAVMSGPHRASGDHREVVGPGRCPMPDHPPCQIIPHPLAQSASAPGSPKIFYDSLFSTLRLAALIEWETEIRQAGEAVLFYLEKDENNALRFSHGFAVDFETLK